MLYQMMQGYMPNMPGHGKGSKGDVPCVLRVSVGLCVYPSFAFRLLFLNLLLLAMEMKTRVERNSTEIGMKNWHESLGNWTDRYVVSVVHSNSVPFCVLLPSDRYSNTAGDK